MAQVVGDEWHDIMIDVSVRPPFCTELFDPAVTPNYDGPLLEFGDCGSQYSQVYFILFKLIGEAVSAATSRGCGGSALADVVE